MDEMIRVECRNRAASLFIGGFRFGTLPTAEDGRVLLSEPMSVEAAARFCATDGFTQAAGHGADAVASVDAEIAAAQAAAESGSNGHDSEATREVGELQNANRAMADELSASHVRIAELERKASTSRLKALEDENVKLAAELRVLREGGPTEDVLRLTDRIEALTGEVSALKAENKDLSKANKAFAKSAKE